MWRKATCRPPIPDTGTASAALQGCGLPHAWVAQPQWRILDGSFGPGDRFLAAWRAWKDDPHRPGLLHYVAIDAQPLSVDDVVRGSIGVSRLAPLARELAAQWFGLLPGTHRLVFEHGHVMLTLHVNEARDVLKREPFVADSVFLDAAGLESNTPKGVARHCRRGTRLVASGGSEALRRNLVQCGFALDESQGSADELIRAAFAPAWEPRKAPACAGLVPSRCIVVGSGLAGAAVASSLALRGWQVTVLDEAEAPAAGASGLPVGMLAPHFSPDDGLLSRLSRSGVRATMEQARSLLREGIDWRPTGVLERRDESLQDDAFPDSGMAWNRNATPGQLHAAALDGAHGIWHEQAAWIKPGALVRAWLSRPGIEWRGRTHVGSAQRVGQEWVVLDAGRNEIARASLVIVAAALGSNAVAGAGTSLQAVRGQVSWGQAPASLPLPPFPLNGSGHFIPGVPVEEGLAWFTGSTFDRGDVAMDERAVDHAANFEQLHALSPAVASQVAPAFSDATVRAWTGVRCASSNRRPIVAEVQPGLWMSTAMGSRGLTFARLCAELLAARLHAEPLPLQARLADTLTPPPAHGGPARR